ncbi:MAG: TatD family hydrolase [Treponema sp.]|jgi:TatD DNase family protein|nr:TatD family hydrolase [Treponema sp.]
MPSDAHAHPYDLLQVFPQGEEERRALGISCAASAWNLREFEAQEELARQARIDRAAPVLLCFAVHPQLAAAPASRVRPSLEALETLVREGRLAGVGETGFDYYRPDFREAGPFQEELFQTHLELALSGGLPVTLHLRRAMHKAFAHAKALGKLPAVIFHAYPGSFEEGLSLLKQGINAYFSFGTALLLNHKTARAACARLPGERLLLETDAPYQPLRGAAFSRWSDLAAILHGVAALRQENPAALQAQVDANFQRIWPDGLTVNGKR